MNEILSFLKKHPLFSEFEDRELKELEPYLTIQTYSPDQWIFREGDPGYSFYIIMDGKVEAVKNLGVGYPEESLGILETGEFFGEMAYLEKGHRSASLKALAPCKILVVQFDRDRSKMTMLEYKISNAMLKRLSIRLRKTDELLMDVLRIKFENTIKNSQMNIVLIQCFIFISFILVSLNIAAEYFLPYKKIVNLIVHPMIVILIGSFSVYIIKSYPYPLEFYGITKKKWGKNCIEGFLHAILAFPILFLTKYLLIHFIPKYSHFSLIDFSYKYHGLKFFIGESLLYLCVVPIQELIARGILQNCMRNFFGDSRRVFTAILSSNLIFMIVHIPLGGLFALGTLFFGIYWGYLYERQKSLVGVIVSHALIGWVIFFVLNFYALDF